MLEDQHGGSGRGVGGDMDWSAGRADAVDAQPDQDASVTGAASEGSGDPQSPGAAVAGSAGGGDIAAMTMVQEALAPTLRTNSAPEMASCVLSGRSAAELLRMAAGVTQRMPSAPLPCPEDLQSHPLDNSESTALEALAGLGVDIEGAAAGGEAGLERRALVCDEQLQLQAELGGSVGGGFVGPMAQLQHAALLAAQQVPHLASYSQAVRQPRDAFGRFQSKPPIVLGNSAGKQRLAGQSAVGAGDLPPPPPPQHPQMPMVGASHVLMDSTSWQQSALQQPAPGVIAVLGPPPSLLAASVPPPPPPSVAMLATPAALHLSEGGSEAPHAPEHQQSMHSLQQSLLSNVMAAQTRKDGASLRAVLETSLALVAAGGLTPAMSAVLQRYVAVYNNNQREQHSSMMARTDSTDALRRWGSADGAAQEELGEAAAAAAAAAAAMAAASPEAAAQLPRLHLLQPQLMQLPSNEQLGQGQLQQFLKDVVVPAAAEAAAAVLAQHQHAAGKQQSAALVVVAPVVIPYGVQEPQQTSTAHP